MRSVVIILTTITILWKTNIVCAQPETESSPKKKGSTSKKIERVDDFITAPYDHRKYRGLKLSNGMKVLLVSDPSTEKAAATLSIKVGAFNDPEDVPGLAALVGFMLLKASQKYPEFYNFQKFVESNNGFVSKPLTLPSEQTFSFFISPNRLAPALDRLAQLFLKPLWYKKYDTVDVDGAVLFVQQEFTDIYSINDMNRIVEVERLLGKEDHPCNRFLYGNEESLYQHTNGFQHAPFTLKRVSLYDKAQKFFSTWYSPTVMTLAVLGKGDLNRLEEMVVPLFKKFKAKDVPEIMYKFEDHPWGPEQLKQQIYIVPLQDNMQLLRLTFPIPDFEAYYKTGPELYLNHLLHRESCDNLARVLRESQLCTNLTTINCNSAGIAFLTIKCALFDTNEDRIHEIIHLIFQYIRLIQNEGVEKWIFEEMKNLNKMTFFDYAPDTENPLEDLEPLTSVMRNYPFQDILSIDYLQDKWDPDVIRKFLSYLRPDNMNVSIISKSFEKMTDLKREKHFQTAYKVEPIPDELIKKWSSEDLLPGLQLPPRNKFIPENFILYPVDEKESKYPKMIHKSALSEVWFRQDPRVRTPVLHIDFEIRSSILRYGDPITLEAWRMFEAMVTAMLLRYFVENHTEIAHYTWEFMFNDYGVQVKTSGYNDKLHLLLGELIPKVINLKNYTNEEKFEGIKKQYYSIMEGTIMKDDPYVVESFVKHLQSQKGCPQHVFWKALLLLQYEDMCKFLDKVFQRVSIQIFINGNYSKEKVMDMLSIIESPFDPIRQMLPQERLLMPRLLELIPGSHFTYQASNKRLREYFEYAFYFQLNTKPSTIETMAACVLHKIIEKACEEMLGIEKPKGQLASLTSSSYQTYNNRGVIIWLRTKKGPQFADEKVETLLFSVSASLGGMSDHKLNVIKSIIKTEEYPEVDFLADQSALYWNEISNQRYHFSRRETELKHLNSLNKNDLIKLFQNGLDVSSPQRRKLSLVVLPNNINQTNFDVTKSLPPGVTKISDITEFKNSLTALPLN